MFPFAAAALMVASVAIVRRAAFPNYHIVTFMFLGVVAVSVYLGLVAVFDRFAGCTILPVVYETIGAIVRRQLPGRAPAGETGGRSQGSTVFEAGPGDHA